MTHRGDGPSGPRPSQLEVMLRGRPLQGRGPRRRVPGEGRVHVPVGGRTEGLVVVDGAQVDHGLLAGGRGAVEAAVEGDGDAARGRVPGKKYGF